MNLFFKLELYGVRPGFKTSDLMLIPGKDNTYMPACLVNVDNKTYKAYHNSVNVWSQYFKSKKIG